ncbi:hypothetical protein AC579_2941 [Pseudocercospora musae]|uniref:Arrestin-like N-terminal domain-containing protein n=1 Tax=Pseudocercospora musae TaxID=113226 RepID=A0A139IF20_9PEZI|nr:hypothetical protein AC579_2941 [Pseudocercospora musae]
MSGSQGISQPQRGGLRIALQDDSIEAKRNRVYHPGDLLTGSIHFDNAGPLEACHVLVSFEGIMRTWVDMENYISAVQYVFLRQSQAIPQQEQVMHVAEGVRLYSMPFKFRIASQCFPNDDWNSQLSMLPPTFENGEASVDRQGKRCMQPLIQYTIRATAVFRNRPKAQLLKCQASRDILFTPWTDACPPLSVDDFPGEFQMTTTQDVRRRLLRTHLGRITLSSCEPQPLPMFSDGSIGRTQGMLQIRATLCSEQPYKSRLPPPRWSCEVHLDLVRHVHSSTMPMKEVASTRLMRLNKYLRLRNETVHSESWKVDPLWWNQRNMRQSTALASFEATIPFAIRPQSKLVPTFASPLSSVRYSIRVQLRFSEIAHAPLFVEVPLQVYYRRRGDERLDSPRDSVSTSVDALDSALPPSYYL